ncbi:hypothetical protein CBM2587_A150089 [Cupriavidus taiwanensis]|uniref:Uncharacterized protein n=1 Tax=Cupriavidus taiwanensis TaxID=164546 RepID=A0A375BI35_9BURK|nr:hypothetical protein CBM2587_A150089 [Cupriavidus taiwanensis]
MTFPRDAGVTRIGGGVYLRAAAIGKLLRRHPLAVSRVAAEAVQGAGDCARQVHRRRLPHHVSS